MNVAQYAIMALQTSSSCLVMLPGSETLLRLPVISSHTKVVLCHLMSSGSVMGTVLNREKQLNQENDAT